MTMKKKLTIRLALLILCAFSMNTAFAQDVRQKPVVKKQTTTKLPAASTKKPTNQPGSSHKWKYTGDFIEGLALVQDANGKWGFIDKTGKVVIPCKWNEAWDFDEGKACVRDANGNYYHIDKTGKVVKTVE